MKFTQLRNATAVLEIGEEVILIDPMLAKQGSIIALKYLARKRVRNPTVPLPENSKELLERVTCCLITHCQKGHFDHLDRAAVKWLNKRNIPVYCARGDKNHLEKRDLIVHPLDYDVTQSFLAGTIRLVPCLHGEGLVGKLMTHGVGYHIQAEGQGDIYLTGDTILSETVSSYIENEQPSVVVIPAGGANFDFGGEVIMGFDDAMRVGEISNAHVIANHLEALDHCPVTRKQLIDAIGQRGWQHRYFVPQDGESIDLSMQVANADISAGRVLAGK